MDRSLTSSLKSTPFSINDILTKNNTTIFRRCSSSGHLSPIDEPSDELPQHLADSMRFFKYSSHSYEHDGNIDQSLLRHSTQNYLFNNNKNSGKIQKYYKFPLMFERPLDMRRCVDGDDSGENAF